MKCGEGCLRQQQQGWGRQARIFDICMLMHKMKEKGDTGNVFLALNEITLGMQHKNEMESGIEENKRFEETVIFEKRRILEESRRDWGIGVWKYKLAFCFFLWRRNLERQGRDWRMEKRELQSLLEPVNMEINNYLLWRKAWSGGGALRESRPERRGATKWEGLKHLLKCKICIMSQTNTLLMSSEMIFWLEFGKINVDELVNVIKNLLLWKELPNDGVLKVPMMERF